MSDSDGGTANARLRADLIEQGRKIVRDEIQPVVERLSALEKSVGDAREKLGEVAATTRNQWYLLGLVFVGVIGVFFGVIKSKGDEPRPQNGSHARVCQERLHTLQPGVLWRGDSAGLPFR